MTALDAEKATRDRRRRTTAEPATAVDEVRRPLSAGRDALDFSTSLEVTWDMALLPKV